MFQEFLKTLNVIFILHRIGKKKRKYLTTPRLHNDLHLFSMDLLNMLVLDMIFLPIIIIKMSEISVSVIKFKFWEFMHVGFLVMG